MRPKPHENQHHHHQKGNSKNFRGFIMKASKSTHLHDCSFCNMTTNANVGVRYGANDSKIQYICRTCIRRIHYRIEYSCIKNRTKYFYRKLRAANTPEGIVRYDIMIDSLRQSCHFRIPCIVKHCSRTVYGDQSVFCEEHREDGDSLV